MSQVNKRTSNRTPPLLWVLITLSLAAGCWNLGRSAYKHKIWISDSVDDRYAKQYEIADLQLKRGFARAFLEGHLSRDYGELIEKGVELHEEGATTLTCTGTPRAQYFVAQGLERLRSGAAKGLPTR